MKKIRRMLSALVLASMLMNVPAPVFAESAGEAPAAVGQQAEAPKQDANDRCLCRKCKGAGAFICLAESVPQDERECPLVFCGFLNFGRKYGNKNYKNTAKMRHRKHGAVCNVNNNDRVLKLLRL